MDERLAAANSTRLGDSHRSHLLFRARLDAVAVGHRVKPPQHRNPRGPDATRFRPGRPLPPGGPAGPGPAQEAVQARPLTVNAYGAVFFFCQEARKPKVSVPFAATDLL